MTFRAYPAKQSRIVKQLKELSRSKQLSPDSIKVYSTRKVYKTALSNKTVSRDFNSIAVSSRAKFTLRAYGEPFNYHGVKTKRYDVKTILKLFVIERPTLYKWLKNDLFPEPFLRVRSDNQEKLFWLYHQIQPMYMWYAHIKARGFRQIRQAPESDWKILRKLLMLQDRRWHARLGIPYRDPYFEKAGRYGVIRIPET